MTTDDLGTRIDELNFAVDKSMRYHQRRRGFYDRINRLSMFAVIICGSAAFGRLFESPEYFAAATTIFAAINLVWAPSHCARDHEMLFRHFSDLAIEIRTTAASKGAYDGWVRKRMEIETDEPPTFIALEADCDNEVRRAWGRTREMVRIDWWSRLTMNLLRHSGRHYKLQPVT